MKILSILANWLFILCLPILLMSASLSWAVNSLWLYKYGFEKYNVSQATGLTEAELEKAARGLIDYFNSPDRYISLTVIKDGKPIELFTEHEIIHLRDVKFLFQLVYYLLGGALALVIIYSLVMLLGRSSWRILASGVLKGSILTLVIVGALALGAMVAFGQLFWWFHQIAFGLFLGDWYYWIPGPGWRYLNVMFPPGFWYDAAMFCAVATAGLAVVLGGVAGGYLLFSRNKAKS